MERDPIGVCQIVIGEGQTAEGELFLCTGIDRTRKSVVSQPVDKADWKTAWEDLQQMRVAVPYPDHTILTE